MTRRPMLFLLRMASVMLALAAFPAQAQQLGIVAVVNDDIISTLDVEQRIGFTLATSNIPDSPAIRERMYAQTLRQLIEESLQIQEAERLNLGVTQDEIDGAFANVNMQRQLPPGSFENFLASHHVSLDTVTRQMRAQIGWSKVVQQSLRSRVRISDTDVELERERLAAGKDISEVNVSSIMLAVEKPEDEQDVRALAERLVEEIRNGANFHALARQFSAGTPEVIDENQNRWVQPHQLEPVLARVMNGLEKGAVSPPIRTLAGYHLIKLHDKRSINTAQVADSEVLLKQITMTLKPDAQQQEAEVLLGIARQVAKHPGQCYENQVAGVQALDDLEFAVRFERLEFRDIQPQLQAMLVNLRVGDVSAPYATPEGIHLVQLCERIDMPRRLPPANQVREQLFRQKIELEAAKRLRELRREALIEVRT